MDVEDRLVITTPEGVTVDLALAGLGSRFAAALVDLVLRTLLWAGLVLVLTVGLDASTNGWAAAGFLLTTFGLFFGYDVLFEVLAGGRTPGKRACGLRVVDHEGGPVRFLPSVVRNLLRLVDALPTAYLVGVVAILATRRNQRLGDLVGRTLVIRTRRPAVAAAWTAGEPDVEGWDVSQVTAEEVATVRRFLERREELLAAARTRLAGDLAGRLRPKVAAPADPGSDERFLELLVAAKARR